jgi:methylglyoxal synthase
LHNHNRVVMVTFESGPVGGRQELGGGVGGGDVAYINQKIAIE